MREPRAIKKDGFFAIVWKEDLTKLYFPCIKLSEIQTVIELLNLKNEKMKKLMMICLVLVSISLQAQPPGQSRSEHRKAIHEKMKKLTPQQRAELKTKKMILDLNLTKVQQSEIQKLTLEIEREREKMKLRKRKLEEISANEFFDRTSKMLDIKIATKKRLQSILTKEQFEKFQKSKQRRTRERRHEFERKNP